MSKHGLTWVGLFLLITTMFLKLPPMVAKQDAVFTTYSALVEVDALVRQKFVEPIHGDSLVHGAIRGMIRQLDAYSGYIAPSELPAFKRRSLGHFIGIGVEIGVRDGRLTIVAPIEGSPAAEAGILAGDQIISIAGKDVDGYSVFDVEDLLSGPLGTSVTLTVGHMSSGTRSGAPKTHTITVERGDVSLTTVRGFSRKRDGTWSYFVDPVGVDVSLSAMPLRGRRIGYLRISNFLGTTSTDFDSALDQLLAQGASGLILDLRFNPGGMMHEAIAIVDRFVDQGVIVSTVNRRKAVQQYRATQNTPARTLPLVVLVNHASASASEIVAGSLQAHGRATVVGERTFGKGCVQHMIYLTEQRAAISLTTAYYRLPNGRIIHRTAENTDGGDWGVTPDFPVYIDDDEMHAVRDRRRNIDTPTTPGDHDTESAVEIYTDRQLAKAIECLQQSTQ